MVKLQRAVTGVAVLAAAGMLTVTACGTKTEPAQSSTPAASPSTATPAAADKAHNQQDVMFAQHMIPHHQQAIELSDTILAKPDIDPKVAKLANQIKVAQGPEIEQMQGWLSQWGVPTMPMSPGDMNGNMPGMDHQNMPGMDHGSMPGMAGMISAQDMDALKTAQGADAAKLFLTLMIEHHQGAITMAQTEIKSGQFPSAVAMAQSIIASQQLEIDDMKAMLAAM